jgi:hypothetical protein
MRADVLSLYLRPHSSANHKGLDNPLQALVDEL